jgi:hypothetical protein
MVMRLKIVIWVVVFSIAMGYLEAAVVVYLRELYYPEGFDFPLKELDLHVMTVELLREAATMVMLLSIGFIAASRTIERLAYFILAFAIWDIFYYVFLRLTLGWPESLLTWDILFLLPVTWVGPVIAPVINSLTMILLCFLILYFSGKGLKAGLNGREWLLLILGAIMVIFAYIQDYSSYMLERFTFWDFMLVRDEEAALAHASQYIPRKFNWFVFSFGQLLFFLAIGSYIMRLRKAEA